MTGIYSILHLLVDGVCALAMFGRFASDESWYIYLLLYNFCAFALQMPLGIVLDGLSTPKVRRICYPSFGFAVVGVFLTLLGALTHPVVLGLGNALFHLGGGVGTIEEDAAKDWYGRGLGVFVAPGAIGLFLGTQLAKNGSVVVWLVVVGVVMLLLCGVGWLTIEKKAVREIVLEKSPIEKNALKNDAVEQNLTTMQSALLLVLGCFLVVILRSYLGMAIVFPWKTTLVAGVLAVLAIASGKMAGGFLAARFGWKKTTISSLGLAAVCYFFSQRMPMGIFALFFFNMTMPITLYLLVQKLKNLPGFAFGILTFGLFLGFLPEYFGMDKLAEGRLVGCLGSLMSLMILLACVRGERRTE